MKEGLELCETIGFCVRPLLKDGQGLNNDMCHLLTTRVNEDWSGGHKIVTSLHGSG